MKQPAPLCKRHLSLYTFRTQVYRAVPCLIVLLAGLLCCGFWGSTEKDIDVKGITSVAVTPFEYTKFDDFSSETGDIVPEAFNSILADKVEWTCAPLDTVKKTMKELGYKPGKLITSGQAKELGTKLGVDMVIFGSLPMYDEHEGSREIQEAGGGNNTIGLGGFTENIRELKVEYDITMVRVADGSVIKNLKLDRSERDTAKDPMMPDSPEKQLRHATRSLVKKLVKRFLKE